MEKEVIPKREQAIDALLISLSGGIIGIIGVILEDGILTANRLNVDTEIRIGGATLVGLSLAVSGAARYIALKKSSKNDRE
jgi:hypothetical protein